MTLKDDNRRMVPVWHGPQPEKKAEGRSCSQTSTVELRGCGAGGLGRRFVCGGFSPWGSGGFREPGRAQCRAVPRGCLSSLSWVQSHSVPSVAIPAPLSLPPLEENPSGPDRLVEKALPGCAHSGWWSFNCGYKPETSCCCSLVSCPVSILIGSLLCVCEPDDLDAGQLPGGRGWRQSFWRKDGRPELGLERMSPGSVSWDGRPNPSWPWGLLHKAGDSVPRSAPGTAARASSCPLF